MFSPLAIAPTSAAGGLEVEWWSMIPFVILLLCIAILPLIHATEHRWEQNSTKLTVALVLGLPVAVWFWFGPIWKATKLTLCWCAKRVQSGARWGAKSRLLHRSGGHRPVMRRGVARGALREHGPANS